MDKKHEPWVKRFTWAFFREGLRTPGYSIFDWLHAYIYGRWTYLYISMGTGEHALAKRLRPLLGAISRGFSPPAAPEQTQDPPGTVPRKTNTIAGGYHGKVMPLETARQLVQIKEDIHLPVSEQVIPFEKARDLILMNPQHIAVLDCPCRTARPHPCLPLDVCLVVGEPFASFVLGRHPHRSRRISQQEAVAILEAEDRRGHVHHAFFKDAMLGRFYAICNCCSCCCGAMQAQRNGIPMLISSGYTMQVNEDVCVGCGVCQAECQFQAISCEGVWAEVDQQACMGCGLCAQHCPEGALALVRDASKPAPLEMCSLLDAV